MHSPPFLTPFTSEAERPRAWTLGSCRNSCDRVREAFPISAGAEITVEVNPGDVDTVFMRGLRDAGVNRVSIGVQSFDSSILKSLGRRHNGREGREAVEAARAAGFDNIAIDLIYGVPGQSHELWLETMEAALGFNPEHLSCYELTVEDGTPFHSRIERGEISLPGEEEAYRFFTSTSAFLEQRGYTHYEVSNFARERALISRHNHKYWDHSPCLGLGPAAHSFGGNRRWWNHRSLELYLRDVNGGRAPLAGKRTSRRRSSDWRPFISASGRNGGSMAPISGSDTASTCSGRKVPPCVAFGMKGSSPWRMNFWHRPEGDWPWRTACACCKYFKELLDSCRGI